MALPACITARRIGVYPECDYDEFGELAAITWICDCGRRRKLEFFDDVLEEYVPVSETVKAEFLKAHSNCKPPKPPKDDDPDDQEEWTTPTDRWIEF